MFELSLCKSNTLTAKYLFQKELLKEEKYQKDLFHKTLSLSDSYSLQTQHDLGMLPKKITFEDFDHAIKSSEASMLEILFTIYHKDKKDFDMSYFKFWFNYLVQERKIDVLKFFYLNCTVKLGISKNNLEVIEEQLHALIKKSEDPDKIAFLFENSYYDINYETYIGLDPGLLNALSIIGGLEKVTGKAGFVAIGTKLLELEAQKSNLDKIEDFSNINIILEKIEILDKEWLPKSKLPNVSSLMKKHPNYFQNVFWLKVAMDELQNALKEMQVKEIPFWTINFPKLLEFDSFVENIGIVMEIFKSYPEKCQDLNMSSLVRTTFIAKAKTVCIEDLMFLMDNFSGFEDFSIFELDQDFEVMSSILKAYPDRFGGSSMSQELAQAVEASNMSVVDYYFEQFPILSKRVISEKIFFYSLESNSNFDMIYY